MKQLSKNDNETPPPSDDDDLLVIDGESYIKKGDFTDDEENEIDEHIIVPVQMDKIVLKIYYFHILSCLACCQCFIVFCYHLLFKYQQLIVSLSLNSA